MDKNTNIEINQILNFKGQVINGQDFILSSIKTPKVISFFPKLNTKICDLQTLKMIEFSQKFPNINFISLSMDSIDEAKNWCQVHKVNNLFFVSDQKYQDFANKTGLHMQNKTLLKRGLIFLDKDNKIISFAINDDYKKEPDYQKIEKYLK